MSAAIDVLNGGGVLNFVTPDTAESYEYCNNGIYVTDTYVAEIGLEVKQGEKLYFQIDNIYMKNATISATGISGDPVQIPDSDAMGYQYQYYIDSGACNASYTLDADFNPKDGHKLLIAGFCSAATGYSGTANMVSLSFIFYDVDSSVITTTPNNTANQSIVNQILGDPPPQFKYESCNTGATTNIDAKLYTFAQGVGYGFGTIGYARNIKNAGFLLATSFSTNVPIFDTRAHAEAYLRDNSVTEGLLNGSAADPVEEYKQQFDYWFIYTLSGTNTRNVTSPTNVSHYLRFMPKNMNTDKIAFLYHKPTAQEPWTLELHYYESIPAYRSINDEDDDDAYSPTENIPTKYIDRSFSFGSDDYVTSFKWLSNIPRADSLEQLQDYFNGDIDISQMSNFDQISRIDNSIIDPNFVGTDKDEETSLGTNGMQYGYGCRLYAMTNLQLATLFNELFDPLKLQDILDGQKIFGSDGITESIAGILYIPLSDLSDICGLGSLANIKIGNWQSENAQGYRINNNSGIIDIGSFTWTPTYNDFRDFEPYTMAFIETGFWGFHQLQISKYYGKTVSCKVAIDVTTGATSLQLFGDGILLDCFEGTCAASRPFVATDNNAYMNSIISAITGASSGAAGAVGNVGAAVSDAGKLAQAGGAVGAAGGVAGVALSGAGVAASGVFAGYNIKNAVDSPPQLSRGNLSGNLGYYSANKISFIIAQKRTIVPENRATVIGLPSGHGAAVGSFSGYLSCSAFKLADGFTGTDEERAEIMEIMRGGIYL